MCAYKKEMSTKQFYINILIGALVGLVSVLIVIMLFAVLMLICKFNVSLASPFSSIALAVGSIIGGYISARKNKGKALLCGLVTAGVIIIFLAAVGLIISQNVTLISLIHIAVTLLGALIGSILGVSNSEKIKVV